MLILAIAFQNLNRFRFGVSMAMLHFVAAAALLYLGIRLRRRGR